MSNVSEIVPLLKPNTLVSASKSAAQEVYPENTAFEQLPIYQNYIGDMIVTYAWELPDSYRFINNEDLSELGLEIDELHNVAVDNLYRVLPELSVQDMAIYRAILAGNDLEASTLLMSSMWDQLEDGVDGNLIAVVPARDVVYFRGKDQGFGDGSEAVSPSICMDMMLEAAAGEWDENPSRQVSKGVYEWLETGWTQIGKIVEES